ncbi:MAG: phosphoribosylformylglycinamidine synthase I [Candidatus Krumholzibacteriales bacterium]
MSGRFDDKVAVIQFPGVNCENETAAAARKAGLEAEVFRWNMPPELLDGALAVILPGGFSYQDRIRAGAVAAKDRIMDKLSALASGGKPVLGICNGAQVLVEAGFIPGVHWEKIDLALAPNIMSDREGYYCNWVYLRVEQGNCLWTEEYSPGSVMPIPIAHAEGRFVTRDEGVIDQIKKNGQIVLRYCDDSGEAVDRFPVNPNGSIENAAGICNPDGNVLAMMPHPERASWLRQIPEGISGRWGDIRRKSCGVSGNMEGEGSGLGFFSALSRMVSG